MSDTASRPGLTMTVTPPRVSSKHAVLCHVSPGCVRHGRDTATTRLSSEADSISPWPAGCSGQKPYITGAVSLGRRQLWGLEQLGRPPALGCRGGGGSAQGRTHGGGGEEPGPPWDRKNFIFSGFLPLNYTICIFEVYFFKLFAM